jgi:glucosamine-6-phosphate deaminase
MKLIREHLFDHLPVKIYATNDDMGKAAAEQARTVIIAAIREKGQANIILATGNSQLSFLRTLRESTDIPWQKVQVFHMDEYLGISSNHPASFVHFLGENFLNALPEPPPFYGISGQPENIEEECLRYTALLNQFPADLVAMGIGENGHLAFNDPPYADFHDSVLVKVVKLAEASRRQQVGEGHFSSLNDVPEQAITLTIPALLRAKCIVCIAPEARKAKAVERCLIGSVDESCPASILRTLDHATLYLDINSGVTLLSSKC